MSKIKKFTTIFILFVLCTNFVFADTLEETNTIDEDYIEITKDIEIRYKWYKEIQTGDYYPLKDITSEDKVDTKKMKFGEYSTWSKDNCSLNSYWYAKTQRTIYIYNNVLDVRYVKLINFEYNDNIKIYNNNTLLKFDIISNENNELFIYIRFPYPPDTLLFDIETDDEYEIYLYNQFFDTNPLLGKKVSNERILIPDKEWIIKTTAYTTSYTSTKRFESELTRWGGAYNECQYREVYVYKYDTEREYYDDNYHAYIEGYIKDTDDYLVYYKGEPIIDVIEITNEKVIQEAIIEYIYIETQSDEIDEIPSPDEIPTRTESSCETSCPEISETKEIQYIEKEIAKIPKKVYIIILFLIIIVIFLIYNLLKNYVERKN